MKRNAVLLLMTITLIIRLGIGVFAGSFAETLNGDLNGNGRLDNRDAVTILRHIEEIAPLDAEQLARADANNDGVVDGRDAAYIVYNNAGLEEPPALFASISLVADIKIAGIGDTITWTANVEGWHGSVSYLFSVFMDGVNVGGSTEYGSGNTFAYAPQSAGAHTAEVKIADERGIIALAHASLSVIVENRSFIYEQRGTSIAILSYSGNASKVTVPATFDSLPVTEIDDGAFENNHTLEKVVLPDSVTRIGKRAFANCSNLSRMESY